MVEVIASPLKVGGLGSDPGVPGAWSPLILLPAAASRQSGAAGLPARQGLVGNAIALRL
jgi:hypothetical protein